MRSRLRPERHPLLAATLLAALALVAVLDPHSAIVAAPALLMLATLFAGARPGERLIERIADNRRKRLARRPSRTLAIPVEAGRVAVLTRRLLSFDQAMRPPPVHSVF